MILTLYGSVYVFYLLSHVRVTHQAQKQSKERRVLILNGRNVDDAETFPFMAGLMSNTSKGLRHLCGGTRISSNMVLTAAHCVRRAEFVRWNVFDLNDGMHIKNCEVAAVVNAFTHPRYYDHAYTASAEDVDPFDVAILQVEDTQQTWDILTLVQLNHDQTIPAASEKLSVLGWGSMPSDDSSQNINANVLQEGYVEYVSNEHCIQTVGTTSTGVEVNYENQVIGVSLCAAPMESAPCMGDSGGPLMLNGTQVGIISASYGCGHESLPSLNVRVSRVKSWIDQVVCKHSDGTISTSFDCESIHEDSIPASQPASLSSSAPAVVLDLKLDGYPTEIGYILEFFDPSGFEEELVVEYPGTFGEDMAFQKASVRIALLPQSNSTQLYRFTMTDNEHDGLTPDGYYRLWLEYPGDNEGEGTLIAEGGDFFLEDMTYFEVKAYTHLLPSNNDDIESSSSGHNVGIEECFERVIVNTLSLFLFFFI